MLENVYEGLNAQKMYMKAEMLKNVKVAQIKKFKKQSPFIFEFCFWEDPPHPRKCI